MLPLWGNTLCSWSGLMYIYLRGCLRLCGYKRMWIPFSISTKHPVFQKSRASTSRGMCLVAGESSHRASVDIGSRKQPCGVLAHLIQELMLLWEGDTSTLNGRKPGVVYECYLVLLLQERSHGLACWTQLVVSTTSAVKEAGELIPCLAINSAF